MPYLGDPPTDSIARRIEIRIRDLLKASPDLDDIKVFYRGEPGFVPVKLHPFIVVFLTEEMQAIGQEGYGNATGIDHYRYDGYIAIEVLMKDTSGLMPNAEREADVPSYLESTRLTQAAFNAVMSWGGTSGELEDDPVVSFDTKEHTTELRSDIITNGLSSRGDNVSNRGSFNFHVYTSRQTW